IDAEEIRRCDPDQREWNIVDENRLPGRVRRSAESSLTESEAGDRGSRRSRTVVVRDDQTPRGGYNREPAKIIAGDIMTAGQIALSFDRQTQFSSSAIGEHSREDSVGLLKELECRVRKDSSSDPFIF